MDPQPCCVPPEAGVKGGGQILCLLGRHGNHLKIVQVVIVPTGGAANRCWLEAEIVEQELLRLLLLFPVGRRLEQTA